MGQADPVGPGHLVEGARQRQARAHSVEQPRRRAVEQALPGRGPGQEAGRTRAPDPLQVRHGVGEGSHEGQGRALGPGGDELARRHADHHGARTQPADQRALAGDPLGEHPPGEGLAQRAPLVEGQGQLALLVAEAGEQEVELEAGRRDVLGVARGEAREDALHACGHATGNLNGARHLGEVEGLRSEKHPRRPAVHGRPNGRGGSTGGALRTGGTRRALGHDVTPSLGPRDLRAPWRRRGYRALQRLQRHRNTGIASGPGPRLSLRALLGPMRDHGVIVLASRSRPGAAVE